jgi:hypothetical protein
MLVTSSALEALLYFYAAGALIAYMMSDHRVISDELYAAGSLGSVDGEKRPPLLRERRGTSARVLADRRCTNT